MASQNFYNEQVNFLDLFEKVAGGLDPKTYVPTSQLVKNKEYQCVRFFMTEAKYGKCLSVELYGEGRIILPQRITDLLEHEKEKEQDYLNFLNSMKYTMQYLGLGKASENSSKLPKHLFRFYSKLTVAQGGLNLPLSNELPSNDSLDFGKKILEKKVNNKS